MIVLYHVMCRPIPCRAELGRIQATATAASTALGLTSQHSDIKTDFFFDRIITYHLYITFASIVILELICLLSHFVNS